jgi:opacity protein-like surface antigen
MPLTAALVFFPAGRRGVLNPYLGVGGGLYWWEYSESGYFWDFVYEEETFQTYITDNETFGFFLLAGLDIPVRPTWSFFVEGRWQELDDDMADDFAGLGEVDLSGFSLAGGFSWKF